MIEKSCCFAFPGGSQKAVIMLTYTYLRYTGTILGSRKYPAPGYTKIAFGNNPTHFQQLVTVDTAAHLKRIHGKELLEIPLSMGNVPMALDTLISASSVLRDETKKKLGSAYLTLGEVIADEDNIYAMFGEYDAPEILNAIRSLFGLPLLPVPSLPVAEAVADEAVADEEPKKKKK